MKVNIGAAFVEGFKVIGREPLSLVGWALALVAYYVVQLGVGMVFGGTMSVAMIARAGSGGFDPGMIGGFLLLILVMSILGLMFFSIVGSAMYRAVLNPSGSRAWARLRVTGVEMTFALTLLLLFVVYFVWYLVTAIICVMLSKISGVGGLLAFLAGAFSALSFVSLFAFVGPMTVDKGRFSFGQAVAAAAGQFWRLIGLNLLLFLLLIAVYIVLVILVLIFMGGTFAALSAGDPSQTEQAILKLFTSPMVLLTLVLVLPIVAAVVQVLFVTPAARAYADAVGEATSQQVEAFS
jgi:hypothetical protein